MTAGNGPVCISVINMKGGVGKTTNAALLGRYASRVLGLKVLAIDLDPQANLSQAFMGERYRQFLSDQAPSIVELFNGVRPPASKSPSPTVLDVREIVVGDTRLGGPNLQLVPSRFDFSDRLINSIDTDPNGAGQTHRRSFSGQGYRVDRLRPDRVDSDPRRISGVPPCPRSRSAGVFRDNRVSPAA